MDLEDCRVSKSRRKKDERKQGEGEEKEKESASSQAGVRELKSIESLRACNAAYICSVTALSLFRELLPLCEVVSLSIIQ